MERRVMKYSIFFAFFIITTLLLSYFACAEEKNLEIKVVMDDDYPPYSFRDDAGKLQGITIDQWELFEQKTGIDVVISAMDWDIALESMKKGQYDVIDTITHNNERELIFDYSEAYATIDAPIFFHRNISGITDAKSLKGFAVGAKKSSNTIKVLIENGITDIRVYDTAQDVIQAAKNQEIMTFVLGKAPAYYYMYKMGIQDEYNNSESLYTIQFYRAVKEGDVELLNIINNGFSKISKKEYLKIEKKWFGNTSPGIYDSKLIRNIFIIVIIITVTLLLLLLWNRLLHIRVREKTEELLQSIKELSISEARGKALLEAIPDMFFMLDKKGIILDYHMNVKLNFDSDQYLNKSIEQISSSELSEKFMNVINKALSTGKIQTIEYIIDIEGSSNAYEARVVSCGSDLVIVIVRDITDRKKVEERLVEMSTKDPLTGTFNRYYFENEISDINMKKLNSLSIIMFDLDGLKIINDTMGHTIGDEYLIATAQIILNSFPKEAIVSRIGGDEFSILLYNGTKEDVRNYLANFNESVNLYNNTRGHIPLSISYGHIFNEKGHIDVFEMLKEADNQMYREKLHRRQSIKSEVVQTMKNLLEARDFITEGHANRMEVLAVNLAFAIGLPEKDLADVKLLAQFHDIGKVGIPDNILFKPSKLNDEEYEIMKRHTEIGHRIAESSVDLFPIADFILKHHEFWNGKGYPFGLKGNEIPLECRILAIVDAYDAMTNDRPYRKAMAKSDAIKELLRCAGQQFDPILIEKFVTLID